MGAHHVPAFQSRDGHDGVHVHTSVVRELLQGLGDVDERGVGVGHGIELVDGEDDRGHAQQFEQQTVAAGLRQQAQTGLGPVHLGGVHQDHGGVGAGCGGHHVAGVLLVTGGVANDELAGFGAEVAVSHIDGDALLALGRQTVGQQRQIGFTLALHTGQVVLQDGFGIDQQTTDERGLAVIHRTAGDELQGRAGGEVGRHQK